MRFGLLSCLLFPITLFSQVVPKEPTAEQLEFFEKSIRPVLFEQCFSCHGDKKQSGSVRLDNAKSFYHGIDGIPIIDLKNPRNSLLLKALQHNDLVKMPPKKKLPDAVIANFTQWIDAGAPFPATRVAKDPNDAHWAFQPIKSTAPPVVKGTVRNEIDQFVLQKLTATGHTLNPQADPRTLVRRVYRDLTGLYPTAEQLTEALTNFNDAKYEQIVKDLLASPRYGEQQARHWMDLARYADTKGYVFQEDRNYPYAYTYREWLINAFNADLPYSDLVILQLAADQVVKPGDSPAPLAAMGFLTVGRRFLNNTHDIIDDRLDTTFRTFQGLTVSCARCHDHKFDPIPIKDYYSLYGVFASSTEPKDLPLLMKPEQMPGYKEFQQELTNRQQVANDYFTTLTTKYLAEWRDANNLANYLQGAYKARKLPTAAVGLIANEKKLNIRMFEAWVTFLKPRLKTEDPIFGVLAAIWSINDTEFAKEAPSAIQKVLAGKTIHPTVRGAFENRKIATSDDVTKAYADFLTQAFQQKAEATKAIGAILAEAGPLNLDDKTWERFVAVPERNRLREFRRKVDEWQAKSPAAPPRAMVLNDAPRPMQPVVFVRGNPGNRGPSVPRQYLEVVAGDQRKPFTQGSGRLEMAKAIADPNNPLTARVMVNRVWGHLFGQALVRTPSDFGTRGEPPTHPELLDWLAGQFMKDGWSIKKLHQRIVLSATYRQSSTVEPWMARDDAENRLLGRMNRKRFTFEELRDNLLQTAGQLQHEIGGRSEDLFKEPFTKRRALYGFVDRQNLPGTFRSFDFALPDTHAPQRFQTTVPQQALYLLNNPFVLQQAQAIASMPLGNSPTEQATQLYHRILQRAPSAAELQLATQFLQGPTVSASTEWTYGYGNLDEKTQRVSRFTSFPHQTGSAWQGGATLPDSKLGWATLNAQGGHAGSNPDFTVIRRWTAPEDGKLTITGQFTHRNAQGDGVRGRFVSSQHGVLGDWTVHNSQQTLTVKELTVAKGETIDFVVDCRKEVSFDSFASTYEIQLVTEKGRKTFDSKDEFVAGPPPTPVNPRTQLAQILLLSNEFAFVD
ncbi:MAG: PSD1 and planctomycete cytochrome C domain-containing protein [Zavarzinella sp.]